MADLVSGARVPGVSLSNDLIGTDSPTVVPHAIPACSMFSRIRYTVSPHTVSRELDFRGYGRKIGHSKGSRKGLPIILLGSYLPGKPRNVLF